jgi:hypothetical protein
MVCVHAGTTWPSSLRRLVLARNPSLTGALSSPPASVTYLDISATGINGALPFPAAMPNLTCLLVRGAAALCGTVADDMPCSVTSAAGISGTNLLMDCVLNTAVSGPASCIPQSAECDAGATQAASLIQWINGRNASAAAALGWSGWDACSSPGWGKVGCEDGLIRSLQLAGQGLVGILGTLLDDITTLKVSTQGFYWWYGSPALRRPARTWRTWVSLHWAGTSVMLSCWRFCTPWHAMQAMHDSMIAAAAATGGKPLNEQHQWLLAGSFAPSAGDAGPVIQQCQRPAPCNMGHQHIFQPEVPGCIWQPCGGE